jgi:hypothetical protein
MSHDCSGRKSAALTIEAVEDDNLHVEYVDGVELSVKGIPDPQAQAAGLKLGVTGAKYTDVLDVPKGAHIRLRIHIGKLSNWIS